MIVDKVSVFGNAGRNIRQGKTTSDNVCYACEDEFMSQP